MNNFKNKQTGAVAVLIAILLIFVFIPLLGLAVDGAYMFMKKNEAQNVADAASLACVIKNKADACGTIATGNVNYDVTSNKDIASVIPYNTSLNTYKVLATYPYSPCPNSGINCALATVSTSYKPFFIPMAGFSGNVNVSASAVAGLSNNSPACFLVLNYISQSGSASSINANGCSVTAGDISKDAGGGPITAITSSGGTGVINIYNNNGPNINCSGCSGNIINHTGALTDPITAPVISGVSPTCQDTTNGYPKIVSGKMTAVPGTYCNKISLTAATVFDDGLYVLKNGIQNNNFNISNTNLCTGSHGVQFYLSGGAWDMSGSGTVNLCAPINCPPASNGLLIYQPTSNTTSFTLSGSGNTYVYTGILDFAGVDWTFNGAPVDFTVNGSMILGSLTKKGNNALTINAASNSCNNASNSGRVSLLR